MSQTALDHLSPHPVMLAPMVGISHYAVRQALSEFLPVGARALWPTEMLNSRRIPLQEENQTPEVCFLDKENGLCPQLLGNEDDPVRESVARLEAWGARAIDINMGCPVTQALKHNYGVALMGNQEYAWRVTKAAASATSLPVSVKLRAGFTDDRKYLLQFTRGLQEAGAAWITIHPRTADQKRRGEADWSMVKFLRDELQIPVIGNGDIQCAEDVFRNFELSGCDRIMIGRALTAKPWLMNPKAGEPTNEEQLELYKKFLLRVRDLSKGLYEENLGLRKLRFLVFHGHVWLEYGHHFYARVGQARTYDEFGELVEKELVMNQRMTKRTTLRH